MANFVATLPKLTSPVSYSFWKIHIKSNFALITYLEVIFTANDILNALVLSQTTNINEIVRRNFLSSLALIILNSILSDNLLMYSQPNTEAF